MHTVLDIDLKLSKAKTQTNKRTDIRERHFSKSCLYLVFMKYISFRILIIFPFVVCCTMFWLPCNGGSSPVYPSDRSAEDNPPLCIFHCSEPSLVQCGVYYGCDCDHCKAGPDSSRIWEPAPLSVSSNSSICTFCISYIQLPVRNISTSILRRITCLICLIFANA